MPDRIVMLAENGRASYRGIKREGEALWSNYQREDDDLTYTLDYTGWLGSDTISTVTRTASGTSVAGTSNTTTASIQRLKGAGYVDVKIVTAGGQTKVDRLLIRNRSENVDPLANWS